MSNLKATPTPVPHGTVQVNRDALERLRGSKSITAFAADIGVSKSTLSRVLDTSHPAEPGPRFIAAVLLNVPVSFGDIFDVVEAA